MWRFMTSVNDKYGLQLRGYPDLYAWSVENVGPFWEEVWRFVGVKASVDFQQVSLPKLLPRFACHFN
jgi:acetoacetyl-CoA synthetase